MAFYIRKQFEAGDIRFSVRKRKTEPDSADQRLFSTGGSGEYLGRTGAGFFYQEEKGVGGPAYLSRIDAARRKKANSRTAIMIGIGAFFLLWGLALLAKDAPGPGVFFILIGLGLAATPLVLSAKEKRAQREREEKERATREEEDRRNQELVGAFAKRLEQLPDAYDTATLHEIRVEREDGNVPYRAVATMAKTAIVRVGFRLLARFEEIGAKAFGETLDEAIDTVGLLHEDARLAKIEIYRRVVWHLLAEDHLFDKQESALKELRETMRLTDEDVDRETRAIEEFRTLRGVDRRSLPARECGLSLKYQEVCFHQTSGSLVSFKKTTVRTPDGDKLTEQRWVPTRKADFSVTSRRFLFGGKGGEVAMPAVFDVELEDEVQVLTVTTSDAKNRLIDIVVPDPIVTGTITDIVAQTAVPLSAITER